MICLRRTSTQEGRHAQIQQNEQKLRATKWRRGVDAAMLCSD